MTQSGSLPGLLSEILLSRRQRSREAKAGIWARAPSPQQSMKRSTEQSCLAGRQLETAVADFIRRYSCFVDLLATCTLLEDPCVRTMGVALRDGRLKLLYNPVFVSGSTREQLVGVIHHEVNHVLFGHVTADPKRFPHRTARLIAEELTANEWVPEPLPGKPITLEQYPQLPANEDTEARYHRLVKLLEEKGRGDREGACSGGETGLPTSGVGHVATLDDHEVWSKERNPGADAAVSAFFKALLRHNSALSPPESVLGNVVSRSSTRSRRDVSGGRFPGGRDEGVLPGESLTAEAIDWESVLQRYSSQLSALEPCLSRPPRGLEHLVGIVPGKVRRCQGLRVLAAIDTSGSVGPETLQRVNQELEQLSRGREVRVVECDAEIQKSYPFFGPVRRFRGRGGTNLCLPLEREFLRTHQPDVVVYFTDGEGPAPERAPEVPVIWCLPPWGSRPVLWGEVVRMSESLPASLQSSEVIAGEASLSRSFRARAPTRARSGNSLG